MSAKRISSDEQFRLTMECRQSGLSDYQWCQTNEINPGTFYNWVSPEIKRLQSRVYPVEWAAFVSVWFHHKACSSIFFSSAPFLTTSLETGKIIPRRGASQNNQTR